MSLTQSAYEAYAEARNWTDCDGSALQEWDDLPTEVKEAWNAAIEDVLKNMGES